MSDMDDMGRHIGHVGGGALSEIVSGDAMIGPAEPGPVQYQSVEVGDVRAALDELLED